MQQQQSKDRKEALATKALQAVVNKIDQFDGRNISRYLRCYVREMELNRVSEKKMVALFGLATIPEIKDHITSITDHCGNSWEDFSHALKDEYFLEDADRVTKKLFLGWIERPNKNLQATKLLREFERQYSQLSKVEKLTLEPNKVDLFLQAADGELQEKLEPLLEDKEEDEGLTTKWKNVEDARKRRRNFDDTREGNSFKRQTRGDKAREAASQELPVKDTSASLGEKTTKTKDKGKSIAYKLLSDIEAATNLKGVLEERILNAKVEFTLKEVLGITKKEFHDVIIDSIKRKRQLMSETGMSHAIDARICRDEEEVDIGYKQPINEKNGHNQRVRFEDSSDNEMETFSHYTRKHWARATTEVLVKVGDIEEPIVALVDHGSEINLMSKDLYKKQKWPIDMEHGWAIRAANNTRGELYGACPDDKIRIWDVATEQHFFVQDTTSYPLILGQPYITATRMETKVLDDGSAYARLRKIGTLQDDERILGVYEENGLEDSLELITSIGLGDNDKIVEIHSREVYTMLESFQAPEVTVETRYKTADKKVKPVAGPLPEDSKEQMGEASKEASLRNPMNIGHQFTEETFEELKIGSDGSLLPEEITCFEMMLAKQGRSFAFESHEIGCVDPNIITPITDSSTEGTFT
uniref:Predicted protein n=1 Tax=Physcomitrium patens TaxID=3218 RepID=A9U699_PHYPA